MLTSDWLSYPSYPRVRSGCGLSGVTCAKRDALWIHLYTNTNLSDRLLLWDSQLRLWLSHFRLCARIRLKNTLFTMICVTESPERCLERCEWQHCLTSSLITACIDAFHTDINGSYSVMNGRQIKAPRTECCHSQRHVRRHLMYLHH